MVSSRAGQGSLRSCPAATPVSSSQACLGADTGSRAAFSVLEPGTWHSGVTFHFSL